MKLFVVGDSTLAKFNDSYYYPRYGYATMLGDFFDIEIVNYALSGRSSKSYILDPEYKKVFEQIKPGDLLLIGFGHNDQKDDDYIRFTSAKLPLDDPKSFKYSLYNNYILPALKIGATPILSTPVPRLDKSKKYEGNIIHDTKNGNYKNAIIELGKELNILVINLTDNLADLYKKLDYVKTSNFFAKTQAIKEDGRLVADITSFDKTHLSIFGAKYVSYLFAKEISKSDSILKQYLKDIKEPNMDIDLIPNPNYIYYEYNTPDLKNYKPNDNFKMSSNDLYGTAFGTYEKNEELYAYQKNDKFIVGTPLNIGRINASSDTFCFVFKQLKADTNFILKAHAKISKYSNIRQAGFGLMLRDDSYIDFNFKRNITTNYVASGLLTSDGTTNIIFSRSLPTELTKEPNVINRFYKEGEELDLSLERIGQRITINVNYLGNEYQKHFYDFDITKIDKDYIYVGLFSTRGTIIEYSDIKFEITGKSKGA